LPILIGLSRKNFVGRALNRDVTDRLYGTLAANMVALMNGCSILRVHDVAPHRDLIKMYKAIISENLNQESEL